MTCSSSQAIGDEPVIEARSFPAIAMLLGQIATDFAVPTLQFEQLKVVDLMAKQESLGELKCECTAHPEGQMAALCKTVKVTVTIKPQPKTHRDDSSVLLDVTVHISADSYSGGQIMINAREFVAVLDRNSTWDGVPGRDPIPDTLHAYIDRVAAEACHEVWIQRAHREGGYR